VIPALLGGLAFSVIQVIGPRRIIVMLWLCYCLAPIVRRIIWADSLENRMYLPLQSLSVILLVGLIAAWVVAKIVTNHGMGIVGDALVGVIGAFIGPWLLPRLGIHLGTGYVFAILSAAVGAVALLLLVRLVRSV